MKQITDPVIYRDGKETESITHSGVAFTAEGIADHIDESYAGEIEFVINDTQFFLTSDTDDIDDTDEIDGKGDYLEIKCTLEAKDSDDAYVDCVRFTVKQRAESGDNPTRK